MNETTSGQTTATTLAQPTGEIPRIAGSDDDHPSGMNKQIRAKPIKATQRIGYLQPSRAVPTIGEPNRQSNVILSAAEMLTARHPTGK